MKYITVKLTEDQANAIWRTLPYGMSDPIDKWSESKQEFIRYVTPDEKKYDAFLQRIRTKIEKALREQA